MSDLDERRWLMAQRLKSRDVPAGEWLKLSDLAYSASDVDIDGMRGLIRIDPAAGNFSWWAPLIRLGVLKRSRRLAPGPVTYLIDVRALPARTGARETRETPR